jgi:hypothetical protein
LNNGDALLNILENTTPSDATPLLLAMQNYMDRDYAPLFMESGAPSYLLIISDGKDTCGSNGVFMGENLGASASELADAAKRLNSELGIRTIVVGFGDGADPTQLNAIAAAGGTQFNAYIPAEDGDELNAALQTIAASVVVSCQFQTGTFDESKVNLDKVVITLDDDAIPRDDNCKKDTGWTWASPERNAVRFCEKACNTLESADIETIKMYLACPDGDIPLI